MKQDTQLNTNPAVMIFNRTLKTRKCKLLQKRHTLRLMYDEYLSSIEAKECLYLAL
jgi:hypothetical protein